MVMLSVDRRREIQELLQRRGSASVAEIAGRVNVSVQTVRRDLERLEDDRLIERVHGGAVAIRPEAPEGAHDERLGQGEAEKRRIGAAAAALVRDGSTIFLSGGTTTEHVVGWLGARDRLTVITNAVNIAYALTRHPSVHVIVFTGELRHEEMTLLGPMAEEAVGHFRIDQALYGCYGLDADDGLYGASLAEASMDRTVMAAVDELVILADHRKFAQRGPVRLAGVDRIKTVVTDTGAPQASVAGLRSNGIEVVIA
jgi:DeoR/GlpR family transcriptional regulator of sugar metabolism